MEVKEQNRRSIEFLNQRHRLMAYLIGLVGDSHVAEDIFQEIWLRLSSYKKDDIENTAAWCRGVGKNLVLHYWREKGNQKLQVNSELIEKIDLAFEESDKNNQRDRKDALQDCLKELPDHSKTILSQKYYDRLSFSDISKSTGKSESSLMMSLSRIRKKLQDCIEQKIKNEGFAQ